MKNGWQMTEIGETDMPVFLRSKALDAAKKQVRKKQQCFMDEVLPGMKPRLLLKWSNCYFI